MAAGTCFLMWLGEKIQEHGIGNGISLIIAFGIVARYPFDIRSGYTQAKQGLMPWLAFVLVMAMMIAVSMLIIVSQEASRKIPVQHARRVVGRRVTQGGSTFLPLKLNPAGVIPVIFSSALLSFPQFLTPYFGGAGTGLQLWLSEASPRNLYNALGLEMGGIANILKVVNFYTLAYSILTIFFCYFYTALTFNPVDLADNLKKSGAFIPGRKPGKHTSDFINYILVRITTVGALILVVVSLVPNLLYAGFDIPFAFASMAGGTGLIIVVGVLLDTMKQVESQMLMRHYEGFKGRSIGRSGVRRPLVRR
jgi:preprotein translocase subunit SecY